MASSSSASSCGAKAFAEPGNLGSWTSRAVGFARGLLKLGAGNDNNQTSLTSMPLNDHAQCFKVVSDHMERHGGVKNFAKQNPIFRWKHTKAAAAILANGESLLEVYVLDTVPRTVFTLSDSTVVTKTGNKNSEDSGALFAKAYNERESLWKDRSQEMYVFAKYGGKQSDFLQQLKDLLEKVSAGGNPSQFRGHVVLFISMNDVHVGKAYVPGDKLDFTREIFAILKKCFLRELFQSSVLALNQIGTTTKASFRTLLRPIFLVVWKAATPFTILSIFMG